MEGMMTVPGGAWCGVVVAVVLAAGACGGNQRAPRPAKSPTASKAADSAIDGAERAVRAAFASHVGDGAGVIALVRVGKNTRVITLGMADVAARRPLKPDDRFPIASITKSVVATAVLQYVASGRAKLDDPVDRFLPGLLPSRKITIRQLLGHRSGLHQLNGDEVPPGDPPSPLAIIRAVARHPLDYAPGTDGAYLNEGYTVLGVLLEKLSRRPLRSVLNDAVFNRAGMTSTALSGEPTVQGYSAYRIGQVAEPPPLDLAWAAGGVVSTVADVDRFYANSGPATC